MTQTDFWQRRSARKLPPPIERRSGGVKRIRRGAINTAPVNRA